MIYSELRAFHAVATAAGFTRAAQSLHVTQPTLSSQVASLEARFGVVLLHRRGRRVEPTRLGSELLSITRRFFDTEGEASELLAAAQTLKIGHLRLAADSPHHIVPALAALAKRYPEIRVSLAIKNSEAVLRELFDYRAETAIVADCAPDPRLTLRELGRDPLVLLVPRRHPWAKRDGIALRDLSNVAMVIREPGSTTRAIFERALFALGVRIDARMEIDSREGLREAVAAGLGLSVVSRAEIGADSRIAVVRIRDKNVEMTEHLVRLTARPPSRPLQALLEAFP